MKYCPNGVSLVLKLVQPTFFRSYILQIIYNILETKTIGFNVLVFDLARNMFQIRLSCVLVQINPLCFRKEKNYNCAFSGAAPGIWNSFPPAIRRIPSLARFKKEAKTFLMGKFLS